MVNNTVTLNTGMRVGHQYQAVFVGSIIATKLGQVVLIRHFQMRKWAAKIIKVGD